MGARQGQVVITVHGRGRVGVMGAEVPAGVSPDGITVGIGAASTPVVGDAGARIREQRCQR